MQVCLNPESSSSHRGARMCQKPLVLQVPDNPRERHGGGELMKEPQSKGRGAGESQAIYEVCHSLEALGWTA